MSSFGKLALASTVASGNDPAGFWFSADVVTSTGATFNIAAKDAFVTTAPEPATWASPPPGPAPPPRPSRNGDHRKLSEKLRPRPGIFAVGYPK